MNHYMPTESSIVDTLTIMWEGTSFGPSVPIRDT